jgi:hypothetical protein
MQIQTLAVFLVAFSQAINAAPVEAKAAGEFFFSIKYVAADKYV